MVIFRVRPVIPTRDAWITILLIGAFGFIAQVRRTVLVFGCGSLKVMKALLTNGLQREAAGRGTLALYTSVCPSKLSLPR
jgi:hypothetical protein